MKKQLIFRRKFEFLIEKVILNAAGLDFISFIVWVWKLFDLKVFDNHFVLELLTFCNVVHLLTIKILKNKNDEVPQRKLDKNSITARQSLTWLAILQLSMCVIDFELWYAKQINLLALLFNCSNQNINESNLILFWFWPVEIDLVNKPISSL